MDSMTGDTDDFAASQLRFGEDTSQLGPLGSLDDGEMMMTLSRAAESADKAEKKRKREEKKRKKVLKRALRVAAASAALAGVGAIAESTSVAPANDDAEIDPALLDLVLEGEGEGEASGIHDAEMEDEEAKDNEEDEAAEASASEDSPPPAKKPRGLRPRRAKAAPAPGYQEIIGPFVDENGDGPAPESILDEDGQPMHFATKGPSRKKHSVNPEELQAEFQQPGAMLSYLAERWMSTGELKRLEDAGVLQYKKGKYTKAEEQAIRASVNYFRQSHSLSEDAVADIIMSKKEKNFPYPCLWSDIALSVPGRPVRFVQKYVKRLYDTRARKGRWTQKEDEDLMRVYETTGGSWVKIAQTVDRSEEDCRARWRDCLRSRDDREAGRWKQEEELQLLNAVKEANTASGKEPLARDPPWEVVSAKMDGKRTQMQCRKKWHAKLWPDIMGYPDDDRSGRRARGELAEDEAEAGPSTPKKTSHPRLSIVEKHKLVTTLENLEADTISGIDWASLTSTHFPRITPGALTKVFKTMIGKSGAKISDPLVDVLEAVRANLPVVRRVNGHKSPMVVPDEEEDDEEGEGQ